MSLPERQPAQMRAADSDREAVAERLREAAGDGRLTIDELEERLEAAYGARTYGQLEALVHDLPDAGVVAVPVTRETLHLSAPISDIKRTGRWRVPPLIVAKAGAGTVKLDFSEAILSGREVVVEAHAHIGSVVLLVPEGWAVDVDGVRSGVGAVKNRTLPAHTGAPLLRVYGGVGVGDVIVRHPRQSRWLPR